MQDFRHMELSALMDMLSLHTKRFSKMLTEGCSEEEYYSIKGLIELLQTEIESRKGKGTGSSVSGANSDNTYTSET